MDIKKHLVSANHDLAEIESLTDRLGNEPSFEEIESILRRRDMLVARMKHGERQLSEQDPAWSGRVENDPVLATLFDESRSLLGRVGDLDGKLAFLIESRMKVVRQKLLSLYHRSRAAYSYVYQNCYRTAR